MSPAKITGSIFLSKMDKQHLGMNQMNTFSFDVFVCDVCCRCQFSTLKG